MLTNLESYLTFQTIYLWVNFSILPFWLMLIFTPNSTLTKILLNSIFLPLIFAVLYCYALYKMIMLDVFFLDIFNLYNGIDDLYALLSDESFLLIFWLHFLAINIFLGTWVARDSVKYNMPKILVGVILILIYLTGPLGLMIFWFFRIFFSKKINFHD